MDIYTLNSYFRSTGAINKIKPYMPSDLLNLKSVQKPKQIYYTYQLPYIDENGHLYINGEDTGITDISSETIDYNDLENKPSLEGEVLQGNTELNVLSMEDIDQIINTEGD